MVFLIFFLATLASYLPYSWIYSSRRILFLYKNTPKKSVYDKVIKVYPNFHYFLDYPNSLGLIFLIINIIISTRWTVEKESLEINQFHYRKRLKPTTAERSWNSRSCHRILYSGVQIRVFTSFYVNWLKITTFYQVILRQLTFSYVKWRKNANLNTTVYILINLNQNQNLKF